MLLAFRYNQLLPLPRRLWFFQVYVCLSLNITQKLLADCDEIFSIDHVGDVHFCLSFGGITSKVVDGF